MSEVIANSLKKGKFHQINSYLETYANPYESRAEGEVSHGETEDIQV